MDAFSHYINNHPELGRSEFIFDSRHKVTAIVFYNKHCQIMHEEHITDAWIAEQRENIAQEKQIDADFATYLAYCAAVQRFLETRTPEDKDTAEQLRTAALRAYMSNFFTKRHQLSLWNSHTE